MKKVLVLVVLLALAISTIAPQRHRHLKKRHRHHIKQNPRIRNIDTRSAVTTHQAGDTHVNHFFPDGRQVIEGPMNRWQPIGQSAFTPTTITPSRQANQFTYHANVQPLVQQAKKERAQARAAPKVITPQDKYDMMIDRILKSK